MYCNLLFQGSIHLEDELICEKVFIDMSNAFKLRESKHDQVKYGRCGRGLIVFFVFVISGGVTCSFGYRA